MFLDDGTEDTQHTDAVPAEETAPAEEAGEGAEKHDEEVAA